MVMCFDAPAMCSSNGVMTWRPLLSTGSLGMVPPLHRYYGTLRLPDARLDPFDIFTSRYHRVARGLLPSVVGVPPGARELSVPVSPSGFTMETLGSLRFLGNPGGHCPCSSTPAGSGRLSPRFDLDRARPLLAVPPRMKACWNTRLRLCRVQFSDVPFPSPELLQRHGSRLLYHQRFLPRLPRRQEHRGILDNVVIVI